jgi:iron complex outermembrane receptor protein
MRGLLWVFPTLAISVAFGAGPSNDTNVVSNAQDAFGITLGPESLGLYNPGSVRGFNPILAGNARIDGLYFDQQGSMFDRLVTDTRIRVGLSAVHFPWPAPSGIVDYSLRSPHGTSGVTSVAYVGPFDSRDLDIDGHTSFPPGHLGITAGAAYHNDENSPGLRGRSDSLAIHPQWTPRSNVSVDAFWGRQNITNALEQPVLYLGGGQRPPPTPTRFFGMPWAKTDNYSEHYGILAKLQFSEGWYARVGIFRSIYDDRRDSLELYVNSTSRGVGEHILVAEPNQYYGSTSGEMQVLHSTETQGWKQSVVLGVRGRSEHAQYGGAETFDFGTGSISEPRFVAQPSYAFGPSTSDRIHEYSYGASYSLQWRERIKLTTAFRRDSYSSRVSDPMGGESSTSAGPLLYDTSLVFLPSQNFTLFGQITRGLEDSGVAPSLAVNRGEVLNATRSSQEEVGAKYSPTASLTLLLGAFDITRTYFGLSDQGFFGPLGQERHRGVELSLAGEVISGLHVVAGVLAMSPEVLATHSLLESIGTQAVGQAHQSAQLALDYQIPDLHGLSVDCDVTALGRRPASIDNSAQVPGYRLINIGARYRFGLGRHSATLRVQVLNVTNTLNWAVQNDGGLDSFAPRRTWAYVVVDW